jgi:hypothetical protein
MIRELISAASSTNNKNLTSIDLLIYARALRVGIRRLRAALSIFRQLEPGRRRLVVASKLRGLQQELGAAREWDVLVEETIGSVRQRLRNWQGLRKLVKGAEAKRSEAHQRARVALGLSDARTYSLSLNLGSMAISVFLRLGRGRLIPGRMR